MEPNKTGTAGWMPSGGSMSWIPAPTPMPSPMPMPTPPIIEPPEESCGDMVLAMSYVKMQDWSQTYEPETALDRGTIFPDLDYPFEGRGQCPNE